MKTTHQEVNLKSGIFFLLLVLSNSNIRAEEYVISFNAAGASTTVTSVKVENMSLCTSLTMDGAKNLRLIVTATGIELPNDDAGKDIRFYPNPMAEYSRMQFNLPESGKTIVSLFDISGREVARNENFLTKGSHTYKVEGIENGIYFVKINCGIYYASGRLISESHTRGDTRLTYESMASNVEKEDLSKGSNAEEVFYCSPGNRLKFTGISSEYSAVVTLTTFSNTSITFNFIACTDGDNNHYPTVKIGNQTWMAENLKTTKFSNGTAIPLVTDSLQWIALTGPGFCWYRNKENPNKDLYGGLYNWFAVTSSNKLCPTGWHAPTDNEWSTFKTYLGTIPSHKLRSTCTTLWAGSNSTATNETGFTALPGGWRHSANYNGKFDGLGEAADWWSSTENPSNPTYGFDYYIDNSSFYSGISRESDSKNVGFSIRCIKD